jgi:hypothetical protein
MKNGREGDSREKIETAAAAGVGASVGGAAGATVGVLELAAAEGTVTALTAGLVIGLGALAGGAAFFFGYRALRRRKDRKAVQAAAPGANTANGAAQDSGS